MLPLFAASLLAPAVAAAAGTEPLPNHAIGSRGDSIIRSPVNALPGAAPRLRPRQNSVQVDNQKAGTRYAVEIGLGTPPQTLTLILDTGSPDTWVNPTCANANVPADCRSFPHFDYKKSSSINATDVVDTLVYGIGNATVQYVYETVTIGSATIKHQVIGVASESHSIPLGILGMSPPLQGTNEYPYVLDTMTTQGLIKSRAFSLDLRGVDNPNGAIIFGGVDTAKYIGDLAKLPMLSPAQSPGGSDRYYITLTGVGLTLPSGETTQSAPISVPIFLDSGSTFSHLPTPIYQAFAESFTDAQYDPASGYYFVPCDVTNLAGSIDFYFGTKAIRVPINDFVWEVDGYCVLGILPDDEEPILGDTFLRAAYVVFDQDNRNIHLAQAADCGSELVAIGTGKDAVPSSKGKCTALPTATAGTATTKSGGGNLDVTSTRAPTNTFTGAAPTVPLGPGPAASRISDSGSTAIPQATGGAGSGGGGKNAAGRGVEVGLGAVLAWAGVHALMSVL